MLRALTIVATAVALAVSAAPAPAGNATQPPGLGTRSGGEVVSSDATARAQRPGAPSFSIDVGTSEALKQVTDGTSNTVFLSRGGPSGIIAILIG